MKSRFLLALIGCACLLLSAVVEAQAACTTIQSGQLLYPVGHYLAGQPIKPGFDPFGYNYQARLFNGSYANVYLGRDGFPPYSGDDAGYLASNPGAAGTWYWPYRRDTINMKWNDAWLSNRDCDGDLRLDRHFSSTAYIGSGAWLTNHMSGDTDLSGAELPHWTYFVKIAAAPLSATSGGGFWYVDGDEMGYSIWGEFAVIQEVYNDPSAGAHGILYKSPLNPGFGFYGNQP